MVQYHQLCEASSGCEFHANSNFIDCTPQKLYWKGHSTEGMLNVHAFCKTEGCLITASYMFPGGLKSKHACCTHKTTDMVKVYVRFKDKGCTCGCAIPPD
jgi:hypothetical protein